MKEKILVRWVRWEVFSPVTPRATTRWIGLYKIYSFILQKTTTCRNWRDTSWKRRKYLQIVPLLRNVEKKENVLFFWGGGSSIRERGLCSLCQEQCQPHSGHPINVFTKWFEDSHICFFITCETEHGENSSCPICVPLSKKPLIWKWNVHFQMKM